MANLTLGLKKVNFNLVDFIAFFAFIFCDFKIIEVFLVLVMQDLILLINVTHLIVFWDIH